VRVHAKEPQPDVHERTGISDLLGRHDIQALTEPRDGPCVSLFLPTHGGGMGTNQDRIGLENLLRETRAGLVSSGLRDPDARRMLVPAANHLDNPLFWQRSSKGLAIFLEPRWSRTYRLPIEVPSRATVARRFQVRPLFPLLSGDGRFYVLALSQNAIRLLVGTRHDVHEVELARMPRGLRDALRYDDPEKERLYHVAGRQGVPVPIFHGRGIGGEVDKERISRYLRLVEAGLTDVLRDERAPLVLAGPDYERAIFRAITRYPALVEEGIPGSPDRVRAKALHARAWPLVEPIFQQARHEAAARYRQLEGTGKTSADLAEIVRAADRGQVDVLFVLVDEERWGTFDPTTGRVTTSEVRGPGDEDLLELAAVGTFLSRGTVYPVSSHAMPDGTASAAILRF
jgi:Bacterial archaeo-eukaryotic release factor family 3